VRHASEQRAAVDLDLDVVRNADAHAAEEGDHRQVVDVVGELRIAVVQVDRAERGEDAQPRRGLPDSAARHGAEHRPDRLGRLLPLGVLEGIVRSLVGRRARCGEGAVCARARSRARLRLGRRRGRPLRGGRIPVGHGRAHPARRKRWIAPSASGSARVGA
jgi:hypothetical protein